MDSSSSLSHMTKSIVKNACKVEEDKVLVLMVEESSSNLCPGTEEKTIFVVKLSKLINNRRSQFRKEPSNGKTHSHTKQRGFEGSSGGIGRRSRGREGSHSTPSARRARCRVSSYPRQ